MANNTLYVGNLPYSATESQLTAKFSEYGSTNARIVEGRGFGFVDVDSAQLQAAIDATNGSEMGGRTLTVNEARPRESNGGGNRGGGGGSYGGGYGGGRSSGGGGNYGGGGGGGKRRY